MLFIPALPTVEVDGSCALLCSCHICTMKTNHLYHVSLLRANPLQYISRSRTRQQNPFYYDQLFFSELFPKFSTSLLWNTFLRRLVLKLCTFEPNYKAWRKESLLAVFQLCWNICRHPEPDPWLDKLFPELREEARHELSTLTCQNIICNISMI